MLPVVELENLAGIKLRGRESSCCSLPFNWLLFTVSGFLKETPQGSMCCSVTGSGITVSMIQFLKSYAAVD